MLGHKPRNSNALQDALQPFALQAGDQPQGYLCGHHQAHFPAAKRLPWAKETAGMAGIQWLQTRRASSPKGETRHPLVGDPYASPPTPPLPVSPILILARLSDKQGLPALGNIRKGKLEQVNSGPHQCPSDRAVSGVRATVVMKGSQGMMGEQVGLKWPQRRCCPPGARVRLNV